ncbi:hydroquinone glucosyltransferase [Quercus suber]|uniref:Hydroquinone glucosyltransferase n=1 Tax=Quercus suber TaxID=58331 RepID=A0AAW0L269_QUESU
MILHSAKQFRLAEGIIFNTFMELEGSAIKALLDEEAKNLSLYPIGPIQSGSSNQFDKSESDRLRWSGGTLSYDWPRDWN